MSYNLPSVAMLGMVGHGKTYLLNKLCGSHFPSDAGAGSCTRALQYSQTRRHKINVIDTPGIGSSNDIAEHIAAQKVALEGVPLRGIYAVVKCGRAADIARLVESLMDFVGRDDIRVIITHSDVLMNEASFNEGDLKARVSESLDIPLAHIALTGLHTSQAQIEGFVLSTLHAPVRLKISSAQVAAISKLSTLSRKFNKPIKAILAKLEVSTKTCERLVAGGKCPETDFLITQTQAAISEDVKHSKELIFRAALDLPSLDAQNVVYGRAGVCLSLALQKHMETTNQFLSWDLTDPRDPRNHYRKCPYCDAVYVKVAGCDHVSCSGGNDRVPDREFTTRYGDFCISFIESNDEWNVRFQVDGQEIKENCILSKLRLKARTVRPPNRRRNGNVRHTSNLNIFCGRKLNWTQMLPLQAEDLAPLRNVELTPEGELEKVSSALFHLRLANRERENMQNLPPPYGIGRHVVHRSGLREFS